MPQKPWVNQFVPRLHHPVAIVIRKLTNQCKEWFSILVSAGCVLSCFAWADPWCREWRYCKSDSDMDVSKILHGEVEAVHCTDIDGTNESDLQGVHSKEDEEINTARRILLSICMVGFDHKTRYPVVEVIPYRAFKQVVRTKFIITACCFIFLCSPLFKHFHCPFH